jgi:hypothetical protein
MFSRLFPWPVLALFALLWAGASNALAEPIQWSYQGQIVTTGPSFNANGEPLGPHVLIGYDKIGNIYYPDGQVQFADVAGSGAASVTAFQMRASTDFGALFSKEKDTFTLGFGILDKASGKSGTLSFTGALDGRMGSGSTRNGFVDLQVGFTGALQKSLVLGDHLYKVSVDSPTHFGFNVDLNTVKSFPYVSAYQGIPVHVQVSDVPEPSTLALAVTGLAGLGLRVWRRRRTPANR